MKTALEAARDRVQTLRDSGMKPEGFHIHVGENGTRCEFCGAALWDDRHDPVNVKAGRFVRISIKHVGA